MGQKIKGLGWEIVRKYVCEGLNRSRRGQSEPEVT